MNPHQSITDALDKAAVFERARKYSDAIEWLRVAADAGHLDTRVQQHVAQAAMRMGQPAFALSAMHQAVQLAPSDADLRFQYACLLAHEGQHSSALEHFYTSVPLQAGNPQAWRLLGVTLQRLGRHAEALKPLRKARELAPDNERVLETLAESEFHAGYPADALPLLQSLWQAKPSEPRRVLRLAETYNRLGRHQDAFTLLERSVPTIGEPDDLLVAMAQTAEDMGDREAAAHAYRAALARRPDWAFPLSGLLGLHRGSVDDALIAQSQSLMADEHLPDPDRALLGYELGKVFDARQRFDEAMSCWHQASAARQRMTGPADIAGYARQINKNIELLTRERLDARRARWAGHPDPRLLFIVGMPRSGTTLTEQILAAHPRGHGGGELPDIGLIVRNLPLEVGRDRTWPECLDDIGDATLRTAAERYLQAATRGAPPAAATLVDKAPLNFLQLGLIELLFPHARVVWCRRDPRDIAVSVYGENFALEERLANALDDIGHYISLQTRLMRHWQSALKLPILELVYEDLARSPEEQARRLIDFAGLPWDPVCLEFHRNDKGVQTPSRWQVKQPIYTRSIGRWRNYETHLEPLLKSLTPDAYPYAAGARASSDHATQPSS